MDGRADGWTGEQTDGWTDGRTGRQRGGVLNLNADAMRLAVSRRPPVRDCMHMLPPIWLVAILTRLTQKLKI